MLHRDPTAVSSRIRGTSTRTGGWGTRHSQLRDLLLDRHAGEQVRNAVLDRRARVLVDRRRAVLVRRARVEREVRVAADAPVFVVGRRAGAERCGEQAEDECERAHLGSDGNLRRTRRRESCEADASYAALLICTRRDMRLKNAITTRQQDGTDPEMRLRARGCAGVGF
jgi:hypothetical protein